MAEKIKINLNLLKYRHSEVLGELINVGALIYYTNERRFSFLYITEYDRLQKTYSSFNIQIFKQQIEFLKKKISNSEILDVYDDSNKLNVLSFLEKHILPRDSSQLQFSDDIVMFYPKTFFRIEEFEEKILSSYLLVTSREVNKNDIVADIDRSLNLWISPDHENRVAKIKKDFIYLPRKRRL